MIIQSDEFISRGGGISMKDQEEEEEIIQINEDNEDEEVTQMADRNDVGKMLLAFLAGGAVGALVGILLAPSSGAETRQKIKDASIGAKDKAKEKMDSVKIGTVNLFSRGKEKAVDVKSQIQAAVEAGKEAYKQKKGELTPETLESETEES